MNWDMSCSRCGEAFHWLMFECDRQHFIFPTRSDTIISKDTRCIRFGVGVVILQWILVILTFSHKKVEKLLIVTCHVAFHMRYKQAICPHFSDSDSYTTMGNLGILVHASFFTYLTFKWLSRIGRDLSTILRLVSGNQI